MTHDHSSFLAISPPVFVSLPSELQRIDRVRPGQHFVPDRSDREPGCKRCTGTDSHNVKRKIKKPNNTWCHPASENNVTWLSSTQRAVLTALRTDSTLDPKRLAVIGGSHGGFLSCHLVGQYPDFYRACAARNPVINAATLLGTSDIVDWWDMCTLHNSSSTNTRMQHIPTALKSFIPSVSLSAGVTAAWGFSIHTTRSLLLRPWLPCWRSHPSHMLLRSDTHADS